MFEALKIRLTGHQPAARISDRLLHKLATREFAGDVAIVISKLENIKAGNKTAKNRISAGVLKLAAGNIDKLDELIAKANYDYRDIIVEAEYPRLIYTGCDTLNKRTMIKIYIADFIEYSKWLKCGNL